MAESEIDTGYRVLNYELGIMGDLVLVTEELAQESAINLSRRFMVSIIDRTV